MYSLVWSQAGIPTSSRPLRSWGQPVLGSLWSHLRTSIGDLQRELSITCGFSLMQGIFSLVMQNILWHRAFLQKSVIFLGIQNLLCHAQSSVMCSGFLLYIQNQASLAESSFLTRILSVVCRLSWKPDSSMTGEIFRDFLHFYDLQNFPLYAKSSLMLRPFHDMQNLVEPMKWSALSTMCNQHHQILHIPYPPGPMDVVGHWKLLPERSMSLMRVSMGVFPTRRTKKSCSITDEETVRREGSRSRSLPNLVGWLGY